MSSIKDNYLVELREFFHEYPEESFKEFNTSRKIRDELLKLSLEPVKIAETGVYADIRGVKEGRTVAFRADIDALPVEEKNDVPYKSRNKGIMHACGHDAHTAMALGIARYFSENREFPGTVRIFSNQLKKRPLEVR
jgi:amidohydrolase